MELWHSMPHGQFNGASLYLCVSIPTEHSFYCCFNILLYCISISFDVSEIHIMYNVVYASFHCSLSILCRASDKKDHIRWLHMDKIKVFRTVYRCSHDRTRRGFCDWSWWRVCHHIPQWLWQVSHLSISNVAIYRYSPTFSEICL